MAVELHEGNYALHQDTSKKDVIQLKLTDSALRAIEACQNNIRGGHKLKPTISFERNQGEIRIPGSGDDEKQSFTFQLSSLNQSASINCLQQHFSRNSFGFVSLLGEIQQKITINATDDSYNTTKKRIEIVKELEKNISTKVIKQPSASKLGKKQIQRRQQPVQKQVRSSFVAGSSSAVASGRSLPYARSESPLSSRSVSPLPGGDLAGVRNKTKPTLSSLSSSSKSSTATATSLHDKVLHYLALRPVRLPELSLKLSRSGTSVDKSKLQNILKQIAVTQMLRPGVAEYTLGKSYYSDVKPDWIGYTEEEKGIIKKKLADIARSSDKRKRIVPESGSSPVLTSAPVRQNAENEEEYSNPVKKKARVSLYHRTSPNLTRPRSVSPLDSVAPTMGSGLVKSSALLDLKDADMDKLGIAPSSGARKRSPQRPLSANSNKPHKLSPHNSTNRRISPLTTSLPPIGDSFSTVNSNADLLSPEDDPLEEMRSKEKNISGNAASQNASFKGKIPRINTRELTEEAALDDPTHEKDEFLEKYKPINYAEQREQYKSDFADEYKEYLPLHQKVLSQLKRFADWQIELAQQDRNTDKYKTIARQVYAEYNRLQEDKEFHDDRRRRDYLHRKLKHIKRLVLEYDSKQFSRKSRRRANDVAQKRAVLTA